MADEEEADRQPKSLVNRARRAIGARGAGSDRPTRQRARILRAIHHDGTASQRDLVRQTHLSASSVSVLCRQLLAAGILEVAGAASAGVGRPLTWLQLSDGAGSAIGLSVAEEHVDGVVTNLRGDVLAHATRPLGLCPNNEAFLIQVRDAIKALLLGLRGETESLLTIGVAVSGVVDYARGILRYCGRIPGPRDVPVRAMLARDFGIHATVEDTARALALAEHRFGAARDVRDFLYVVADTGVGAGLFLDGRPYRGAHGMAGEVGHVVVEPGGAWCSCGKRGCLETVASQGAIEAAVRRTAGASLDPSLAQVAEAAASGDQFAVNLLTYVGDRLGDGVAAALNLFGVELVVLGGSVPAASPLVARAAAHTARLHTVAGIEPAIKLTTLDADAAARGVATLALDELFATDDHPLALAPTTERAAC